MLEMTLTVLGYGGLTTCGFVAFAMVLDKLFTLEKRDIIRFVRKIRRIINK